MNSNAFKRPIIVGAIASALVLAAPKPVRAEFPAVSGYFVRLEGGAIDGNGDDTTYAELASFPSTHVGRLKVEADDGWFGRAEFGVQLGDSLDVRVRYSRLDSDGDQDSGVYGTPTYAYPVLGKATTFYSTANATAEASYDVVDFEAGYHTRLGNADVRLAAGIRVAELDQSVRTAFRFPPGGTAFVASERRDVDFNGAGPRVSAELSIPVASSNFHVGGAIGAAVLFGEMDSKTRQVGTPGIINANTSKSDDDRTIHSLDAEISLSYRWQEIGEYEFDLSAGYRGERWYDVNDTSNGVSQTGARFGSDDADQSFHGPFMRLTYSF